MFENKSLVKTSHDTPMTDDKVGCKQSVSPSPWKLTATAQLLPIKALCAPGLCSELPPKHHDFSQSKLLGLTAPAFRMAFRSAIPLSKRLAAEQNKLCQQGTHLVGSRPIMLQSVIERVRLQSFLLLGYRVLHILMDFSHRKGQQRLCLGAKCHTGEICHNLLFRLHLCCSLCNRA